MQWEGQELHTQLFSPGGSAQEVPVSNILTLKLSSADDANLKRLVSLSAQDLLTSSVLSDSGHKGFHLPLALEQSHKYLSTFPSRTLVM